jgi:hypothetical protein
MTDEDTILVHTADTTITRKRAPRELKVDVLAENVNLFLSQIEGILQKTPDRVADGKFKLTEFTVSAEISAKGGLVLMGTGVEAEGKGGLTFKFERKA